MKKILLLIPVLLLALILRSSSVNTKRVAFPDVPPSLARWEVLQPNNYLGTPIYVTLYITTLPGSTPDLKNVPGVGEILRLPPRTYLDDRYRTGPAYQESLQTVTEGELEIRSKTISVYEENDTLVTRIDFELQYLQPIDLEEPADKKTLSYLLLDQHYFIIRGEKVFERNTPIRSENADFYILHRVDEDSIPLWRLFSLEVPPSPWRPFIRISFALIGIAIATAAYWTIGLFKKAPHPKVGLTETKPDIEQLHNDWVNHRSEEIFLNAVKLYRKGVWGQPLRLDTYWETTIVIYSGNRLSEEKMDELFNKIMKEVK